MTSSDVMSLADSTSPAAAVDSLLLMVVSDDCAVLLCEAADAAVVDPSSTVAKLQSFV